MRFDFARSLLFLPADRLDRIEKAIASPTNGIILDLEDGMAEAGKLSARASLAAGIAKVRESGKLAVVRINSGRRGLEDLEALAASNPHAIMAPKVESKSDIARLEEQPSWFSWGDTVGLIALIESPLGVLRAADIAGMRHHLVAIAFGAEDYATLMDVSATADSLRQAAGLVALAARANGLPAFGVIGSIAEVKDEAAFSRSCEEARTAGFTGALTIHPRQSALAAQVFAPTEAEVLWARAIVEDAEQSGQAVFLDRAGRMVDLPILTRAQRIVARADCR